MGNAELGKRNPEEHGLKIRRTNKSPPNLVLDLTRKSRKRTKNNPNDPEEPDDSEENSADGSVRSDSRSEEVSYRSSEQPVSGRAEDSQGSEEQESSESEVVVEPQSLRGRYVRAEKSDNVIKYRRGYGTDAGARLIREGGFATDSANDRDINVLAEQNDVAHGGVVRKKTDKNKNSYYKKLDAFSAQISKTYYLPKNCMNYMPERFIRSFFNESKLIPYMWLPTKKQAEKSASSRSKKIKMVVHPSVIMEVIRTLLKRITAPDRYLIPIEGTPDSSWMFNTLLILNEMMNNVVVRDQDRKKVRRFRYNIIKDSVIPTLFQEATKRSIGDETQLRIKFFEKNSAQLKPIDVFSSEEQTVHDMVKVNRVINQLYENYRKNIYEQRSALAKIYSKLNLMRAYFINAVHNKSMKKGGSLEVIIRPTKLCPVDGVDAFALKDAARQFIDLGEKFISKTSPVLAAVRAAKKMGIHVDDRNEQDSRLPKIFSIVVTDAFCASTEALQNPSTLSNLLSIKAQGSRIAAVTTATQNISLQRTAVRDMTRRIGERDRITDDHRVMLMENDYRSQMRMKTLTNPTLQSRIEKRGAVLSEVVGVPVDVLFERGALVEGEEVVITQPNFNIGSLNARPLADRGDPVIQDIQTNRAEAINTRRDREQRAAVTFHELNNAIPMAIRGVEREPPVVEQDAIVEDMSRLLGQNPTIYPDEEMGNDLEQLFKIASTHVLLNHRVEQGSQNPRVDLTMYGEDQPGQGVPLVFFNFNEQVDDPPADLFKFREGLDLPVAFRLITRQPLANIISKEEKIPVPRYLGTAPGLSQFEAMGRHVQNRLLQMVSQVLRVYAATHLHDNRYRARISVNAIKASPAANGRAESAVKCLHLLGIRVMRMRENADVKRTYSQSQTISRPIDQIVAHIRETSGTDALSNLFLEPRAPNQSLESCLQMQDLSIGMFCQMPGADSKLREIFLTSLMEIAEVDIRQRDGHRFSLKSQRTEIQREDDNKLLMKDVHERCPEEDVTAACHRIREAFEYIASLLFKMRASVFQVIGYCSLSLAMFFTDQKKIRVSIQDLAALDVSISVFVLAMKKIIWFPPIEYFTMLELFLMIAAAQRAVQHFDEWKGMLDQHICTALRIPPDPSGSLTAFPSYHCLQNIRTNFTASLLSNFIGKTGCEYLRLLHLTRGEQDARERRRAWIGQMEEERKLFLNRLFLVTKLGKGLASGLVSVAKKLV